MMPTILPVSLEPASLSLLPGLVLSSGLVLSFGFDSEALVGKATVPLPPSAQTFCAPLNAFTYSGPKLFQIFPACVFAKALRAAAASFAFSPYSSIITLTGSHPPIDSRVASTSLMDKNPSESASSLKS